MKITGLYQMAGSKFWWYRWQENGKRHAISLKTDDVGEAIKKVREIQSGTYEVQWQQPTQQPTTLATKRVEDYLAKAQKRAKKPMRPGTAARQGAILLKFLKDAQINDARTITLSAIEKWLNSVGGSKDTQHTYARVLHTFIGYLVAHKLVSSSNFEKFDIPERAATGRKNWLKLDVANSVIANAKDKDLRFVLFCGFHAGLRKSEIIAAKVSWFDLDAGLLHVQNDVSSGFVLKDRENRAIPLTRKFKTFLVGYLAGRNPNEYVLKPGQVKGNAEYRYDFKRALYTHFKRCGVVSSIHDMRRSFASNRVSHGVSIYKVAKWLGDGIQVVEKSYGYLAPADRDIDIDPVADEDIEASA
jgi:integrase